MPKINSRTKKPAAKQNAKTSRAGARAKVHNRNALALAIALQERQVVALEGIAAALAVIANAKPSVV